MVEHQVPVVVEVILERVTNISMGTEIDNVVEFEDLASTPRTRPRHSRCWTDRACGCCLRQVQGTLTSAEVAVAVGAGVRRLCPDATVVADPSSRRRRRHPRRRRRRGLHARPDDGLRPHRRDGYARPAFAAWAGRTDGARRRRSWPTSPAWCGSPVAAGSAHGHVPRHRRADRRRRGRRLHPIILGIGGSASTDGGAAWSGARGRFRRDRTALRGGAFRSGAVDLCGTS